MGGKLFGVILAGGKSLRMGTDKGLITIGDTCWAAFMVTKLHDVNLKYLVSINSSQIQLYRRYFIDESLLVDNNDLAGPIAGLLSIYAKYPKNDFLLLACDMIDMQRQTIETLIKIYNDEPGYNFYVYQNEGFVEPFCAIYTAHGLEILFDQLSTEQLSGSSLQMIFDQGLTKRISITDHSSFTNRNTIG